MYSRKLNDLKISTLENQLWITLNRPQASNAFTVEMIQDLVDLLYFADEDDSIHCIIITGEGKHFCAGGDIKQMLNKEGMFAGESNELRLRYKRGIQKIPVCFNSLSTPTIAMVNGAAIGAGLDLACMCDIRIASTKAKFGETFTKLGLIPGDGGTYFLQRVVGYSKAMEMTLTAKIYNSEEALSMNLVSSLFESDELLEKVRNIADQICSNSAVANSMAKRSIVHARNNDLYSTLDLLASYQGITQRTPEHFNLLKKIISTSKDNS